jgi:hypothetical protein
MGIKYIIIPSGVEPIMKCEDVDKFVVFALVLTLTADIIFLVSELKNQWCDKREKAEGTKKEKELESQIKELNQRITNLEKKLS